MDKIVGTVGEALQGVPDGAIVMIGGFGTAGTPNELIEGLIEHGARELTIVSNNAGNGDHGLAALLKAGRVRKIICSFPRRAEDVALGAFVPLIETTSRLKGYRTTQAPHLPELSADPA